MNSQIYNNPPESLWSELCQRPRIPARELREKIDAIFYRIKEEGDRALLEMTAEFDKVWLNKFELDQECLEAAGYNLSDDLKAAISCAYENISKFHRSQLEAPEVIETCSGVHCWRETRAIEKVGIYIPGGSAPLFSTVLMLGIPAKLAGCREVILCTPPREDGTVHPAILYCALKCGIRRVFCVGGAHAIAAMAIGTQTIPVVYKIFGPGNQFVTEAKIKAAEIGIPIDMPAGPSELLVFGDSTSDPVLIASDLLSQAEHGPDSQVVLVSMDYRLIEETKKEILNQLRHLPRAPIATVSLENARFILFDSLNIAIQYINVYAPEHLILATDNAKSLSAGILNAGSVFIGHMTPESAGDYASGTNHTLPTGSFARMYSGVSLDSFVKKITFQSINEQGIRHLAPTIIEMAESEGLKAHAEAVRSRLRKLDAYE